MKFHLSEEIIIWANISSSTQLSEGFYQIPGESRIKIYLGIRWINAFLKWVKAKEEYILRGKNDARSYEPRVNYSLFLLVMRKAIGK